MTRWTIKDEGMGCHEGFQGMVAMSHVWCFGMSKMFRQSRCHVPHVLPSMCVTDASGVFPSSRHESVFVGLGI